ncbi:MAG: fumarylacetoacetase [Actinomycetota bacterium]|nr:fumarylacetoacetase [Actinomycetota bacterium]
MSTPTAAAPTSPPTTWLDLAPDDPYGLATLPYGVFSTPDRPAPRIGVRIGDRVLDVGAAATLAGMESGTVWRHSTLNPFLGQGASAWAAAREWLTLVLSDESYRDVVLPHLVPLDRATLHLPIEVADYVDFYAAEHHARRASEIFRPGAGLGENWKHLPVGYHGRAGTVVVSGTDVVRPTGQRRGASGAGSGPDFGPSTRLDLETELGFVLGAPTTQGTRVPVDRAHEHLFGVVLLNDWSARDLQAWESAPLGPFLGKSFATSISAWVTPMAALEAARVTVPGQDDPVPLPYLAGTSPARGLDLQLELRVGGSLVSRPRARDLYWSPEQLVAHLTVGGASIRNGDLLGSGTVSGADAASIGCLLELSWGGRDVVTLSDGTTRTWLLDGDTVTITATAPGPGGARIGVGEVTGRVRPAV